MEGEASDSNAGRIDVLLACSAGGHLLQLFALREAWSGLRRVWVTLDKADARSLLASERVYFAHEPTDRSISNLVRNLALARRLVRQLDPAVILTTGAAIAVPFAWVGWLHGTPVVYVESLARVGRPSLSCRLVAPVADRLYVQWPELQAVLRKSRYSGSVFGGR